jgi:hypothetical protein
MMYYRSTLYGAALMSCLVLFACLGLADGVSAGDRTAKPDAVQQTPQPADDFSPLHDLLGIDPKTGEFKPRGPRPQRQGASSSGNVGSPSSTAQEATRKIGNLANRAPGDQQSFEGELGDLNALLRGALANEQMTSWNKTLALATAAVCMIFPLGMVLGELLAFFWRPRGEILTAADRRYLQGRFWRRIIQALAIAGLILLATLATVNLAWWSDAAMLSVLAVAAAALGLTASTLSYLGKQAAGERTLEMVRELRQQQMELHKDLEDLRKRLRQVTIHSA